MTSLPSRLVSIRRRAQHGVGGLELRQDVRNAWLDRQVDFPSLQESRVDQPYLFKETLIYMEALNDDER